MSAAAYRIDLEHDPVDVFGFVWKAHVNRISDESLLAVRSGKTPNDAMDEAREYVRLLGTAEPARQPVYVDEAGNLTNPPHGHSVRVEDDAA